MIKEVIVVEGKNDINIKVRKIRGFLDNGDHVKIMIVFRGREMAHKEMGQQMLEDRKSVV